MAWEYYNRPFPPRPAGDLDFEKLKRQVQEALQGDLAAALAANPKGGRATATSPTEAEMPTPPSPTSPASPPPPAAPAPPSSSIEAALPSGNKEAVQHAPTKKETETEATKELPIPRSHERPDPEAKHARAELSAAARVKEEVDYSDDGLLAAAGTNAQPVVPRKKRKKRRKHKGCQLSEPEGPEAAEESPGSRRRIKSAKT